MKFAVTGFGYQGTQKTIRIKLNHWAVIGQVKRKNGITDRQNIKALIADLGIWTQSAKNTALQS